ncbi:hypothetical protein [Nitratifractor salsuginis]|uniref:Uncharacterized protein n=1 Tax=Nitratifractor salsuginis (strain DSM 16511 / JCM 12458 / E9I37-1) TaxID=749222 RepID=E6X339_NITSE|nr:hypothetical protein [Nitratifractor salsuginis]ADV46183.1 hypothetical protein Nitsa_0923 [Nitratifractor salsuginis DSM 16511]
MFSILNKLKKNKHWKDITRELHPKGRKFPASSVFYAKVAYGQEVSANDKWERARGYNYCNGIDYSMPKEEELQRGGTIVFPIDLDPDENKKFISDIKRYFQILDIRIKSDEKFEKIIRKSKDKFRLSELGYSIGSFFKGRYIDEAGHQWDDKSFSIDVIGISSDFLKILTEDISKEFTQKAILLKDYNLNKIYLLDEAKR